MRHLSACGIGVLIEATLIAHATVVHAGEHLGIPEVQQTEQRLITSNDMAALRRIEGLAVSGDGRRYAIFVRQGDPRTSDFVTGWFAGDTRGGALTHVADGGEAGLIVRPGSGTQAGEFEFREGRWSPDGQWLAYAVRRRSEVQLWRSSWDGRVQERVTQNAADVRDFEWSADGTVLYFTTGPTRDELHAREKKKEREGYQYDEDLIKFTDFMEPRGLALENELTLWVVSLNDRQERQGDDSDCAAFRRAQMRHTGGREELFGVARDAVIPPVARRDGAQVWMTRAGTSSQMFHVMALLPGASQPTRCPAAECSGAIQRVWWSEDQKRVFIMRFEWPGNTDVGLYAWSPSTGMVRTILRAPDDYLYPCAHTTDDHLVCARETQTRPAHVVTIDLQSGAMKIVADVNPEFQNIRLGRVERFEWETPKLAWNEPGGRLGGLYPDRAFGYILYPPDFDPSKKYPVIIDPYRANRFEADVQLEQPRHVYAANGFLVLNTQFPLPIDSAARLHGAAMKELYSDELEFPHLTMLMEATLKGLDTVATRGFIDEHRVGIGGVSHGSFVPLYMLQKHDRITAISVSSPSWSQLGYYWLTAKTGKGLDAKMNRVASDDWIRKPEGDGLEWWKGFDIADHIDAIEAPILMNLTAAETFGAIRLLRALADAGKAYDAYVFPSETHIKYQPSHLDAIRNRNLDWFRFWLQGYEDPDPAKQTQYARWRELRQIQCRNPRSLQTYCVE